MPLHTSSTPARANLAELFDRAIDYREVVVVDRRGRESVTILAASELAALEETAHLLRSPKNAERLLKALERARGRELEPSSTFS